MNQCSVQKPPSFMVFKFISAYVQVRSYTCLGFHSNILCCSSGKQYTSKWLWDWVLCFPAVHRFRVNRTCAEIKMEKLEPTKDELSPAAGNSCQMRMGLKEDPTHAMTSSPMFQLFLADILLNMFCAKKSTFFQMKYLFLMFFCK